MEFRRVLFRSRPYAILAALGERAPAIRDAAVSAIAGARRQGPLVQPDPIAFAESPSESIDYAVMEHWNRMAVAPVEMGWSDLGSRDALPDFAQEAGHAAAPDRNVVALHTADSMIRSRRQPHAAHGTKASNYLPTKPPELSAHR